MNGRATCSLVSLPGADIIKVGSFAVDIGRPAVYSRNAIGSNRIGYNPVAFRLKKAACVVAGTFNMYIVQPAWLAKVQIVPEGIEVAIASKLDEPGFRFTSPKLRSQWFVTPSRIEVQSEHPEENCGAKVAAILAALPWTPLVALGNNALYSAPLSELEVLPEPFRATPQVPEHYQMVQRSSHFGLSREERLTNLQLSITREEIELSVNVHTELRDKESGFAQAAARRFFQDRADGESLMQQLFKARVQHGNSDGELA